MTSLHYFPQLSNFIFAFKNKLFLLVIHPTHRWLFFTHVSEQALPNSSKRFNLHNVERDPCWPSTGRSEREDVKVTDDLVLQSGKRYSECGQTKCLSSPRYGFQKMSHSVGRRISRIQKQTVNAGDRVVTFCGIRIIGNTCVCTSRLCILCVSW